MTKEGSGMEDLDRAYREAERIMSEKAVSFFHAFKNLPEDRFRGVTAVYAFCRFADDVSDSFSAEFIDDAKKKSDMLDELEYNLVRVFSSKKAVVPWVWWPAFVDTVHKYNIPEDAFLKQIRGQRTDLFFSEIRTIPELIDYCDAVAGSVGMMLLPVLADDNAQDLPGEMRTACERLGIGMQITNILRDVGEDLSKRNRVYLPSDIMAEHRVSRELLVSLTGSKKPLIPESFISLWEELAALADSYYENYLKWLHRFHRTCRLPLVAAALNYHAIADSVRESGYDCFTRRNYTSAAKRDEMIRIARQIVSGQEKTDFTARG